jgi:hypothetical protein
LALLLLGANTVSSRWSAWARSARTALIAGMVVGGTASEGCLVSPQRPIINEYSLQARTSPPGPAPEPPPAPQPAQVQVIEHDVVVHDDACQPPAIPTDPFPACTDAPLNVPQIPVYTEHHIGVSCTVVSVIDIHDAMGSETAAFDQLRQEAVDAGGNAILGAEYHHPDGPGEPLHLSGLAVHCAGM